MNLLRLTTFLLEGTCLFFIIAFGACNENFMKPIGPKMCVQLCARTVGCGSAIYTTSDLLGEKEQETVNITGVRQHVSSKYSRPDTLVIKRWITVQRGSILFHSRTGQMLCNHVESYEDLTPDSTKSINALYWASKEGNLNMVKYIVTHRLADINSVSKYENGRTPIMTATRGNVDVVKDMLNRSASSIDARDVRGETAVMKAASAGHLEIVKLLVEEGCDLTVVDKKSASVLRKSCKRGRVDIVKYLLSQSVDWGLEGSETNLARCRRHGK